MRSHERASRQPDPVKILNVTLNPTLGCLPVADEKSFQNTKGTCEFSSLTLCLTNYREHRLLSGHESSFLQEGATREF